MRRTLLLVLWVGVNGCSDNGAGVAGHMGDLQGVGGDQSSQVCGGRVLPEVTNARDLGGQTLEGGYQVACRQIIRGGELSALTGAGCTDFAALGISTVIDLRDTTDLPPASCVSSRARVISAPLPKLLPDTPDNYLALLEQKSSLGMVFEALGQAAGYPVYIHCVIGRDRASVVSALVLLALGASRQTVIDEFNLSARANVPVQSTCIETVLDHIDTLGGIKAYLTSLGVTPSQLDGLLSRGREKTS